MTSCPAEGASRVSEGHGGFLQRLLDFDLLKKLKSSHHAVESALMWISICAAQLLVRTASTFLFTALCTTPHFDVKPTCHLKHTRAFRHHQPAANCPFGAVQVSSHFSSSSEGKTWPLWLRTRQRDADVNPKPSYLSLLVDDGHRVLQFDIVEQTGQEDIGHTDQAVILLLIEKWVSTFEIGAHHLDRGKRKQELVRTYNQAIHPNICTQVHQSQREKTTPQHADWTNCSSKHQPALPPVLLLLGELLFHFTPTN